MGFVELIDGQYHFPNVIAHANLKLTPGSYKIKVIALNSFKFKVIALHS
jgi:hypothetical protein